MTADPRDRDYERGWATAKRGAAGALDRAHERGESADWYAGYHDRAEGRGKRPCIRTAGIAAEFVGQDPERSGQFARVTGEVVEQRRGEAVGPLVGYLA